MPDKSTSGPSFGAQPITGRAGADRCARNWAIPSVRSSRRRRMHSWRSDHAHSRGPHDRSPSNPIVPRSCRCPSATRSPKRARSRRSLADRFRVETTASVGPVNSLCLLGRDTRNRAIAPTGLPHRIIPWSDMKLPPQRVARFGPECSPIGFGPLAAAVAGTHHAFVCPPAPLCENCGHSDRPGSRRRSRAVRAASVTRLWRPLDG
jgi:hypothetical protein